MFSLKLDKGQSLLILVLMISLILAVLSAVSYRLTVDTQISRLQDEAVSALAGADAGIEIGLNLASTLQEASINGPFRFNTSNVGLTNLDNIDATKSQITILKNPGNPFATPDIPKDSQYTYYLVDPNNLSAQSSFSGRVNLYFKENSNAGPSCNPRNISAIEISVIGNSPVSKYLVEPCTVNKVGDGNPAVISASPPKNVGGVSFSKYITFNINSTSGAKFIVIRPLFANLQLGFEVTTPSGVAVPFQGKTIRSYAVTNSGVTRTIDVIQSPPQLPAEFFVTQL
jgi:hypothetical protein